MRSCFLKSKTKFILFKIIYTLLYSVFFIFSIFYFFKEPILDTDKSLIIIYSSIGLIGILWLIHPNTCRKAINSKESTKDNTLATRVIGGIFFNFGNLEVNRTWELKENFFHMLLLLF